MRLSAPSQQWRSPRAAAAARQEGAGVRSAPANEIHTIGTGEGQLDLVAWQGYTEPNVVKPFEAQTGCQVHVKYGQTSDEMVQLIRSGQWDGVSASGDATNRLIAAGNVAPIDVKLIPDFKDITPALQSPPHNTVNGVHYGVSYEWGANVLMYNTKIVKPAPHQLGAGVRRHQLLGQGDGVRQPDLHRRCGALPEVGRSQPEDHRSLRADREAARRGGDLLKKQRQQIGDYWSSYTSNIQDFKDGNIVIGQTWPYQYNTLKAEHVPVAVVLPKEGATGWADTWMMYSHAKHPNCMLKWMAYATTPVVQGKTAYTFGSAPANPKACAYLDKQSPGYCTAYHVTDPAYFSQIKFWKTPLAGLR